MPRSLVKIEVNSEAQPRERLGQSPESSVGFTVSGARDRPESTPFYSVKGHKRYPFFSVWFVTEYGPFTYVLKGPIRRTRFCSQCLRNRT